MLTKKMESWATSSNHIASFKHTTEEVPVVAQWLTNPTRNHEVVVRSLAPLSGLRIWCCCELWCRPAATAPIQPPAWEPPHAVGAALGMAKRKKKKKRRYG